MSYDFREKIDYGKTSNDPIWGTGDEDTNKYLEKTELTGKWLNLAAGDGRYMGFLLRNADRIVVNDIDRTALDKLIMLTPENQRVMLEPAVFDIDSQFPFSDETFDGVFCTGTLHLFPKETMGKIASEITRVTKQGGRLLIDLATDIRRVMPNGDLRFNPVEPRYTLESGKKEIEEAFRGYYMKFVKGVVPEEEVLEVTQPHVFSCNYWLVDGSKK
ncbi:MAG: class I SAM-dependent methyltransferase [Patescibacteria group bacterium]